MLHELYLRLYAYIVTVIGLFFYQPNTMPMIRQEYKNYYNTCNWIVYVVSAEVCDLSKRFNCFILDAYHNGNLDSNDRTHCEIIIVTNNSNTNLKTGCKEKKHVSQ